MTRSEFEQRIAVLRERHPMLLRKYAKGSDPRVPPGWVGLLERLCEDLEALNLPSICFDSIGEKYGELRIDIGGKDLSKDKIARVDVLLTAAENASAQICMWCGAPGETRGGNRWQDWIFTACEPHCDCPASFYDNEPPPSSVSPRGEEIVSAMREAGTAAVRQHLRAGRSVPVFRAGKIVWLRPDGTTSESEEGPE